MKKQPNKPEMYKLSELQHVEFEDINCKSLRTVFNLNSSK